MRRTLALTLMILTLLSAALPGMAAGKLTVTEEAAIALPEQSMYKISGVITNEGKQAADIGFIRVELLDKKGKTLRGGDNIALPHHLEPGESAYFGVTLSDLDGKTLAAVDKHAVSITEEKGEGLILLPAAVITPLDQINEEEGLLAEYTNNTGAGLASVRVAWVLRDEAGKLIDVLIYRSKFQEPLADGAKSEAGYYFSWMTPSLADCLEKGLDKGSAACLVFAIK